LREAATAPSPVSGLPRGGGGGGGRADHWHRPGQQGVDALIVQPDPIDSGQSGGAGGPEGCPVVIARVEARVCWVVIPPVSRHRALAARRRDVVDTVLDVSMRNP